MSTDQTFIEQFITNNTFDQLTRNLNDFFAMLNEVRGITEYNPKIIKILNESNLPLNGSDEDIKTQYETWYDQLAEFSIKKDDVLKKFQDNINLIRNNTKQIMDMIDILDSEERINKIIYKETFMKDRINVTLNHFVDKIIEKEKIIYCKKMDNLSSEMKKKYDTVEVIYETDPEVRNILPSFNELRKWSGKQKCSVIFDSKIDGDGGNNVLMNKVIKKKNLYFITFDNQNNVFGGYVDTIINKTNSWIIDPNAFTFSLLRNGNLKNSKYVIKANHEKFGFHLWADRPILLYCFGSGDGNSHDVFVFKTGNKSGKYYFKPWSFNYNGEGQPLRDGTSNYTIERVIVLQMN
ncbi:TLDc domain-containing protein [Entamoeba marina]